MNRRAIRYRDTWAAPGSQLFEALEAGDTKKANDVYVECEIALLRSQGLPDHRIFECLPGGTIRLFSAYERMRFGWPVRKTPYMLTRMTGI